MFIHQQRKPCSSTLPVAAGVLAVLLLLYPNRYTLIFSDPYQVLQKRKTKGLFSFGNPYDATYIRTISVTTD